MALTGNVTLYKKVDDLENGYDVEVENPDGTVETKIEYPRIEVEDSVIEDAYVIIRIAAIHAEDYDRFVEDENGEEQEIDIPRGETKSGYTLFYRHNIYTSKEARQDRYFSPLHEKDCPMLVMIEDLNLNDKNLIEYCYDHLKTQKGYEDLAND